MSQLLEAENESPKVASAPISAPELIPQRRSVGLAYTFQLMRVGTPLWFFDMLAVALSLGIALLMVLQLGKIVNHFPEFLLSSISAYSLCFWAAGTYPGVGVHPARELKQLFRGAISASLVLSLCLLLVADARSPYLWMIGGGFLMQCVLIPVGRSLSKSLMRRLGIGVPFYFLGNPREVSRVFRDMTRFGWTMLSPAGRFCDESKEVDKEIVHGIEQRVPYLGTLDDLGQALRRDSVYWLFVTSEVDPDCPKLRQIVTSFADVVWLHAGETQPRNAGNVLNCGLASGVRVEESLLQPWPMLVKRGIDLFVAISALAALLPLIAFIAIAVRLSSKGPVFYAHQRIGRAGRLFKAWKFRSMVANADRVLDDYLEQHPELRDEWEKDQKLKSDPRVTWIGRIIRKTSLDELPQLWNVVMGEMSLVGPRPIVESEIEKYGDTFRDYLRVAPGITGLWQISGRNNTTYGERLAYDEFYVSHWSPWMDLYILFRTVKTVLFCEGAY